MPCVRLTISQVLRMTVSVFSPRKSIFNRPSSPTGFIAYCVTSVPLSSSLSGSRLTSGSGPDDDARRVDTGVAREVFEDERGVNQLARDLFIFVSLLEFRHLLERFRQRHFQFGRNQFRQPVAVAIRQTHHAADIAHHRFCAHRAEGDDLRDGIAPVFFADIFDHVRAAVVGEINVNIRRTDALGIQETLEQQRVADRDPRSQFRADR